MTENFKSKYPPKLRQLCKLVAIDELETLKNDATSCELMQNIADYYKIMDHFVTCYNVCVWLQTHATYSGLM